MGKFCFSCGAKIPENCKFCPKCGTSQIKSGVSSAPQQAQSSAPAFSAASAVSTVEPKKDKTKLILIIIGAIIAIALIVLCIVLIVKPGDSSSGGSRKSDKDDVEAITPYAKLNGDSLSNCKAAYSYSSQYGTIVCISGYLNNDGVSVGVALDDSLCKSGSTLTDKNADSSSFFDILISSGSSSYEYTSADDPDVFGSCEFELQSYKEKSEVTFTISVSFTYEGYEYQFEGGATADYQDINQGSQGGNYNDDDYGNGGGYYDDDDYGNGAAGTRMCGACYGNGVCSVCDGTGQTHNWDGNKVTCQSCHGSGRCIACGGTGYY